MFPIVLVVVLVAVLCAAYLIDRHDRRHGHTLGDPSTVYRAMRDANSDARAIDANPVLTKDVGWTASSRRNQGKKPH